MTSHRTLILLVLLGGLVGMCHPVPAAETVQVRFLCASQSSAEAIAESSALLDTLPDDCRLTGPGGLEPHAQVEAIVGAVWVPSLNQHRQIGRVRLSTGQVGYSAGEAICLCV